MLAKTSYGFCGFFAMGLALCFGGLSGCSRSNQYQQDQQYFQEGTADPNYAKRIEKMGQPRKKVAVLTFINHSPVVYGEFGDFAAEELRRELAASQRVLVAGKDDSQYKTADFVDGDDIKVAQLVREGRRLGVSLVVVGRIAKLIFRQRGDDVGVLRQMQSLAGVEVEVKVFDVLGGREVLATGRSGEASNNSMVAFEQDEVRSRKYRAELIELALRNAIKGMIPNVLAATEKMSWEGKIAKVSGAKVFLNAGKSSGLIGGDILRVLTPGDDVYDPDTGAYLGRTQGQLKGTLEVVDFMGDDAAVANVHSGGQFQPGDIVRLY